MRSRRRRGPPAGSVCWMLTLMASRRHTAAADLAPRAGLSRVQSHRFGLAFGRDRRRKVVGVDAFGSKGVA